MPTICPAAAEALRFLHLPACRGRRGSQVLDNTASRSWTIGEVTLQSDPPVKAIKASLALPLKAAVRDCASPSATIALSPTPSIIIDIILFGR